MDLKATLLSHYFPLVYQRTQWTHAEALRFFLLKEEEALITYMGHRASGWPTWPDFSDIPDYTKLPTRVALYKNWFGAWTLHVDIEDMSGGITTPQCTVDYLFREMQKIMGVHWNGLTIPIVEQWELFLHYCEAPDAFEKKMSDYWVTGQIDALPQKCSLEEITLY